MLALDTGVVEDEEESGPRKRRGGESAERGGLALGSWLLTMFHTKSMYEDRGKPFAARLPWTETTAQSLQRGCITS